MKTDDVKLDTASPRLEIRESKFRKSRVVPLHPTTAQKIEHYARLRSQRGYHKLAKSFLSPSEKSIYVTRTLRSWFARTIFYLGMRDEDGRRTATLHGLRHYFAVERLTPRLTQWCQQGAAAEGLAPTLSIYMGHVSPAESYWYLTSTPELLRTAGDSFQSYMASEVIHESFADLDRSSTGRFFLLNICSITSTSARKRLQATVTHFACYFHMPASTWRQNRHRFRSRYWMPR